MTADILALVALGEDALADFDARIDEIIGTPDEAVDEAGEDELKRTDPLIADAAKNTLTQLRVVIGDLEDLETTGWPEPPVDLLEAHLRYLEAWARHLRMVAKSPQYWELDPGADIKTAWQAAIRAAHFAALTANADVAQDVHVLYPVGDLDSGAPEQTDPTPETPSPPRSEPRSARTASPAAVALQQADSERPSKGWLIAAVVMAVLGAFTPVALAAGDPQPSFSIGDMLISGAVWFGIVWFIGWLAGGSASAS